MLISERCRSINPSKTLVIAEQAEALRAEGKDIIFMNAGQPDFDTPLHIKAAAMEGMQEAGEDENMALEHRLSYLALIGTVAPMLGLMGTVQGMIASFDKIASSAVSPKPSELAEGISTALFTTLIGLGIAIPAMVFYSILKNRIQRLVLEIGMVSEGLMSRFAAVGKGGAGGTGTKPA